MQLFEWNKRVGLLEVHVRRNVAALHRQHRLDEPRNPRRSLQMTQIRLHRTDQKGRVFQAPATENGAERPRLDGITQQRARPVRFDVVHLARVDVALGACGA